MSAASVANFVESLRKSRFLKAGQIEKVLKAQERFPDAVTLAKELVRKGWLTREQAQQLLQGKTPVPLAPVSSPAEAPTPSAPPSGGRRWLLVLLILLLLGGGAGLGWWYSRRGDDGRPSASNRSTESQDVSPIGVC